MMEIFVMRPGENAWLKRALDLESKWIDQGLTDQGREQVEEALFELPRAYGEVRPDAFYSSLVPSSRKTAEIVRERIGSQDSRELCLRKELAPVAFPSGQHELVELLGQGVKWQALWLDSQYGFETPGDYFRRTWEFLDDLKTRGGKKHFIVASEELFWYLIARTEKMPFHEIACMIKIPYAAVRKFKL